MQEGKNPIQCVFFVSPLSIQLFPLLLWIATTTTTVAAVNASVGRSGQLMTKRGVARLQVSALFSVQCLTRATQLLDADVQLLLLLIPIVFHPLSLCVMLLLTVLEIASVFSLKRVIISVHGNEFSKFR